VLTVVQKIEIAMSDLADLMDVNPVELREVDPKSWRQLMTYAPDDDKLSILSELWGKKGGC
jgi:hypothetical protein